MKLAKQRFAIWFNKTHHRYGTLWSERFKSVLVEPQGRVIETMALYIDLNAVRAGLVSDPKDYRFCGYAEAVAGNKTARQGIQAICAPASWTDAQSHYREALFGTGSGPREHAKTLPVAALEKVLREKGRLPLSTVLRCRIRYFSDGAVLGSQAFVAAQLARYVHRHGSRERTRPRPLKPLADWGDLATLRGLRNNTFG